MSEPRPDADAADADRGFGPGSSALLALTFLGLFHYVGIETWGHGRESFPRLLVLVAVVVGGSRLRSLERRIGTPNMLALAALALAAWLARSLGLACRDALLNPGLATSAIDIARNVYEAGNQFVAGHNPYGERCQLGHVITPGPHITNTGGVLRMFGLEYRYGFPYFPAMILAYLPFRSLADGLHSIRLGNAAYLVIAALGAAVLAGKSVARPNSLLAASLALVAFLGVEVLAPEHFQLGVTDICIAAFAVVAYAALASEHVVVAGVFLGIAQAAKLLPGPLLMLPALAYVSGLQGRRRLFGAYALVSVILITPAFAANPEGFVSSTVAFYLTYHNVGDDTSLYWFLPEWAKAPFLGVGLVLALGFALVGFRRRPASAAQAAGLAWASYMLFITFNRMTHLNYMWSVHSLGAAALATAAFAPQRARHTSRVASSLAARHRDTSDADTARNRS